MPANYDVTAVVASAVAVELLLRKKKKGDLVPLL
jgi:hypothetical protein